MPTDQEMDRLAQAQRRGAAQHMRQGCRAWTIFTAALLLAIVAAIVYVIVR